MYPILPLPGGSTGGNYGTSCLAASLLLVLVAVIVAAFVWIYADAVRYGEQLRPKSAAPGTRFDSDSL